MKESAPTQSKLLLPSINSKGQLTKELSLYDKYISQPSDIMERKRLIPSRNDFSKRKLSISRIPSMTINDGQERKTSLQKHIENMEPAGKNSESNNWKDPDFSIQN